MKRVISILLVIALCSLLSVSALAAEEGPVITLQPQNLCYPEYSVAIYTVKATGNNLSAYWYIEWQGTIYNASQIGGAMQPWEAYAGESYGAKKLDNNTFCFIFQGIGEELNGAKIWCDIEDGHYSVTSQPACITVGNYGSPPEILEIPAAITVEQGEEAEIRCVARSSDQSQLDFLWYETDTGNLSDIRALNRGEETGDFLFCDTSQPGTRYYVCAITTAGGGAAYSSVVAVNVVEKAVAAPVIQTEKLPGATVGIPYSVQLQCSDSEAEFFPYYDANTNNDLEDGSWIGLSIDGWLMGTPTKAGTYSFCVCAVGAGGEDYAVYTLVVEAAQEATTAPTETTQPTPTETVNDPTPTETVNDPAPTETVKQTIPDPTETAATTTPVVGETGDLPQNTGGIAWWVYLLVAIGAAGIGVGAAMLLIYKEKHK